MGQVKYDSPVSVTTAYKGIVWSAQCPAAFTFPNLRQVPIRAGLTQGHPPGPGKNPDVST